jgi:hypothetical protein
MNMWIYIYIHINIYVYIHVYIHICIHTFVCIGEVYFESLGSNQFTRTVAVIKMGRDMPQCIKCCTYADYVPPLATSHHFPHYPGKFACFNVMFLYKLGSLCMYRCVCIYANMFIYIYIYMNVCICIYIHIYTYIYIYVNIYINISTDKCIYMYIYTFVYILKHIFNDLTTSNHHINL